MEKLRGALYRRAGLVKIYLLIILMSYYFGGINDCPVVQKVVDSPKEAAILLMEKQESTNKTGLYVNFSEDYKGHLYEIDLKEMTIKEVKIPQVQFVYEDGES